MLIKSNYNKFGCKKKIYNSVYIKNEDTKLKTSVLIKIHKKNLKYKEIMIRKIWRIWVSDIDLDEVKNDILKKKKIKNNLIKKTNLNYDIINFIKKF